ncbi:hypothetical protein OEB99_08530 [Actinotalea sp. M2MS4P-6]|uniref:hypothetical protein n=1 Tax=Actinotalea sp. M2MS4P-6 TaxID=2983762 RepID=UPI0021E48B3C|nr:hypothetical protein [Actinotalea sp. M2MS4P-6]MCV2394353.1 hypothetical protein [Actinotalea sp. M2MS4P-6]
MAEPMLIGAVAAQQCTVAPAMVLEALRRGAEDVAAHSMGIDLRWSTTAINAEDDLGRPGAATVGDGLDPGFVADRWSDGTPQSGRFSARSSAMQDAIQDDVTLYDPRMEVVTVACDFPAVVGWSDEPVGGLVVWVGLQRWAMYGGGATMGWAVGRLERWVLDTAVAIGATAGFLTATDHPPLTTESPWELATGAAPSLRDVAHKVWGFGWGTLLGRSQLDALEGTGALDDAELTRRDLPGGRAWLRLPGDDPAAVTDARMDALRRALGPVLDPGPAQA